MKGSSEGRLVYIDLAKGFGIICVILGHMGNTYINRFVFSFHMPLFFMISGLFLSTKITAKETFKRRIKQLLPPYILTSFAIIITSILKNIVGIITERKSYLDLIHDVCRWTYAAFYGSGANHDGPIKVVLIGAVWFLLASIFSSYFVRKALDNKYPGVIVVLIALTGYFTSKVAWLPWSIQAGMTATVFMYMGVVIKNIGFLEKYNVEILGAAIVLWINEIVHGRPCIGIVENQYPNGAFDFVGGGSWSPVRNLDNKVCI